MNNTIQVEDISIGGNSPLTLIAGPCVIESYDNAFQIAKFLKEATDTLNITYIFKASYDKANRTSIDSFRGPGKEEGLNILKQIKDELGVKVISDVHTPAEVEAAAKVLDIIQIPALLCRQTDLIVAAAESGLPVNIKKGQFAAPWDMENIVNKAASTGNKNIMLTERGTSFGYNNLTVDFRGINIMQQTGCPVIFDATHSVQLPGGQGSSSGGQREFAPVLAKAAVAAGADGIFIETHPQPDKALCDGPNSILLQDMPELISKLIAIREVIN